MADEVKEVKEEEKKCGCGKSLKVIFKALLGIILLGVGGALIYIWKSDLLVLVKGSLGLFLVLAGIITLAIAKE